MPHACLLKKCWYDSIFTDPIITLRPNKKAHPQGGLSYLDGHRDSKRATGAK